MLVHITSEPTEREEEFACKMPKISSAEVKTQLGRKVQRVFKLPVGVRGFGSVKKVSDVLTRDRTWQVVQPIDDEYKSDLVRLFQESFGPDVVKKILYTFNPQEWIVFGRNSIISAGDHEDVTPEYYAAYTGPVQDRIFLESANTVEEDEDDDWK